MPQHSRLAWHTLRAIRSGPCQIGGDLIRMSSTAVVLLFCGAGLPPSAVPSPPARMADVLFRITTELLLAGGAPKVNTCGRCVREIPAAVLGPRACRKPDRQPLNKVSTPSP